MNTEKNIAEQITKDLLNIKAVQFSFKEPFQWSSGWNSPIYCDCRLTLSYPEIRQFITEAFIDDIKEKYPSVEGIAGVATAGVPQGALVAEKLGLPFIYVRSKAKGHGRGNQIEGLITKGQKLVVIEDIISTGKSSILAVEALREAGFNVLSVLAILTYNFDFANENFAEKNIIYHTLTDYNKLLVEIFKREGVSEKAMASLHEWRKNPDKWKGTQE